MPDGPGLYLRPRLALGNLFLMWEYAYRLEQFRFLEGMAGCDSLDAFYENLAGLLAGRVLDRARKGFYRAYLPETDRLPFLRGRMDTRRAVTRPWDVNLQCNYEEHTGDVEENQILAWTLRKVARNSICREEVRGRVRGAYRALRSFVAFILFAERIVQAGYTTASTAIIIHSTPCAGFSLKALALLMKLETRRWFHSWFPCPTFLNFSWLNG